jgi:ABC-type microcin C transport system permease subunit YejE
VKLLQRATWIATFLSPLLFVFAVLLSSKLGNGLALTTQDYCISGRMDATTGRIAEVPKLLETTFVAFLLAAIVPPPFLWATVLVSRLKLRKSPP